MNFRKKIQEDSPGFQMAPMLDIMFILLVHFMAATLFAKWETKLDITVPTAESSIPSSNQRAELIINIDKEGVLSINSIEMGLDRLREILQLTHTAGSSQPVILRADENCRHKDVIKVLDLCAELDIRNVSFATIRSADEAAP